MRMTSVLTSVVAAGFAAFVCLSGFAESPAVEAGFVGKVAVCEETERKRIETFCDMVHVMRFEYDIFNDEAVAPYRSELAEFARARSSLLLDRKTADVLQKGPRFLDFAHGGSKADEFAKAILAERPLMLLACHPGVYQKDDVYYFVKNLPTVWDETRDLKNGLTARRKGVDWYVAGRGLSGETVTDLSFCSRAQSRMIAFGEERTERIVSQTETLRLKPSSDGAVAFRLVAPVALYFAGDSTLSPRRLYKPNGSWGDALAPFLSEDVRIVNCAVGGRSTKSFLPHWKQGIAPHMRPGDWVLIQFGANDAVKNQPYRSCTPEEFAQNLRNYVAEVRAVGAKPLLVSCMGCRRYSDRGVWDESEYHLKPYAAATAAVAAELKVPFVEMTERTLAAIKAAGPEGSKALFKFGTDGKDNVHPSKKGAQVFVRLFLSALADDPSNPANGLLKSVRPDYDKPNYDEAKVASYELEDPCTFFSGEKLAFRKDWPARRQEILDVFAKEMYGVEPPAPESLVVECVDRKEGAYAGFGVREQYKMWFRADKTGPCLTWLVIRPRRQMKAPVPVVLFLNYHGNAELVPDKDIPLMTSWCRNDEYAKDHRVQESCRGSQCDPNADSTFPVGLLLARGYAVMSACYCEVSPDPDFDEPEACFRQEPFAYTGVFGLWGKRDPSRTDNITSLGAWAWALSRGLDLAERLPEIDARKSVVTGCSRLGKAALIAAARDERFAVCVPNQCGGGGVCLAKRDFGECIGTEMWEFSHWFCKAYGRYARNPPQLLTFDQHLLLSAIAPRRVLVEGYAPNDWMDTKGEYLACRAASAAWEFLGLPGLPGKDYPDAYETSCVGSHLGYVRRTERHGIAAVDWQWLLDFADGAFGDVTARSGPKEVVALEGTYPGHLQDVWRDGTSIWWAQTQFLLKTDGNGRILRQAEVGGHHAGLEIKNGRLYTAVCAFNGEPRKETTPQCHVMVGEYDAETLERIDMHVLDINDRAGSFCFLEDGSFLVGCLRHPSLKPSEVKFHHIGADYRLIKTHVVELGTAVDLGIEVIKRDGDAVYLFIYGGPVVRLDAKTLEVCGRYESFGGELGFSKDGDFAWVGVLQREAKTGRLQSLLVRKPISWKTWKGKK